MAVLAVRGGTPVRKRPFPAWPRSDGKERRAIARVCASGCWGTLGPEVARFEESFARYLGVTRVLAVSSGTAALEIILRALDIGPGDEVIVPPWTFIATASAVLMVGATPVFADIERATNCLDPASVEAAVTARTKAVIPVHLAGHPADMDGIAEVARRRGLFVVEDCAQAHGAAWRGRKVGSLGTAAAFSFQNSKNMAAGEGGAIAADDPALAEKCWSIHHIGRLREGEWYEHHVLAGNYRMTEWQAAVLVPQLARLDGLNGLRHRNAELLSKMLGGIPGIGVFTQDPRCTCHAHHLFLLRWEADSFGGVSKKAFAAALAAEGIPAAPGYLPLHRQWVFDHPRVRQILCRDIRYAEASLPVTEEAAAHTLWLTQNVLLGAERDLRDVRDAILKVREHAGELAGEGT
jgi:dTDP-4-amino-4,6-dideoxygalactose transaminase